MSGELVTVPWVIKCIRVQPVEGLVYGVRTAHSMVSPPTDARAFFSPGAITPGVASPGVPVTIFKRDYGHYHYGCGL